MSEYDLDNFKPANRQSGRSVPRHAAPRNYKGRVPSASRRGTSEQNRRQASKASSQNNRTSANTRKNSANSSPRKAADKKPAKKGSTVLKVIIAVLIVAVVATGSWFIFTIADKEYRKSQPFRFSNGVTVSGIDISGLLYDEAEKKLEENKLDAVKDIELTISADKYNKTFKKENFKYNFNFEAPLSKAKVYSLKEQGIYEGKDKEIESTTENPNFNLEYSIEESSVTRVVNRIANKVNKKPVNARVSKFVPFANQRFTYKAGKQGRSLENEDLERHIIDFFESGKASLKISALVDGIEPEITIDDLKRNIVGLSQATSYSTNNANGNHNMATALKACNGSVIEPGATWSFNKCTGDSNLEKNGYKKADVINNKKIEQGVGGGICQASTTIFKSAVFANMAVVERHNHYWASSYAYAGEDATIDYPNLDLKLKNTTKYQMFMECKMEGTLLTVNIYGYQEPTYDNIQLLSENHDIEKGESYKTTTTRVLYLNGKVVKKEVICNSTYSLKGSRSVRIDDTGSYRKTVNGVTKTEAQPVTQKPTEKVTQATAAPTTAAPTTEPTQTEDDNDVPEVEEEQVDELE